jgi:NADH-quinone oxidoreductase subunit M
MLWLYQRVFTGPENDGTKNIIDLNTKQTLILTPVVVLTIIFGLFPAPVIKVSETAVSNTLKVLKVSDPLPRIEMVKQND